MPLFISSKSLYIMIGALIRIMVTNFEGQHVPQVLTGFPELGGDTWGFRVILSGLKGSTEAIQFDLRGETLWGRGGRGRGVFKVLEDQ